jgi:hypothetical protein
MMLSLELWRTDFGTEGRNGVRRRTCSSSSALLRKFSMLSSCEPPMLHGCDPPMLKGCDDPAGCEPLDVMKSSMSSCNIDVSKLSFSPPSTMRQELSGWKSRFAEERVDRAIVCRQDSLVETISRWLG